MPRRGRALFAARLPCPSGSRRGLGGFGRLPALPVACFAAPYPPSPLPRRGRGRDYSFLMQGASPLASPHLSRKRHGLTPRSKYPAEGISFFSPANPAFSFPACPHPPPPLPLRGRGRHGLFLCKGLRPLHPRELNPWFAAKTTESGSLWAVPAAKERGDRGRWNYPSQATAAFEMVLSPGAGIASAVGVQPSPSPPKTAPPSPREVGILFKECTVNMVKAPKLDAVMENGKNTC